MTRKVFIIAEAAQGYEGSLEKAQLLLRSAVRGGADAFKIQIFDADEIARPDYKYYQLFCRLEMPFDAWAKLIDEARTHKIQFFADVFGLKTANRLFELGIDGYKIHCSDISNPPLLKFLSQTGATLLLSCGGSTLEEIGKALDILSQGSSPIYLLTGFQGEPSPVGETHLNRLRLLREKFQRPVGIQDHIDGGQKEAFWIPLIALGAGAEVIEKHITLSRVLQLEDFVSALTPEEFYDFVRIIREMETALGDSQYILSEKEREYRTLMKKYVVARQDIAPGTVLSYENLVLKRTGETHLPLFPITEFIGKKAMETIQKDQVVLPGATR